VKVRTSVPAAALGLALILGGAAVPAAADQAARSNDPEISSLNQSPADLLRAAVADARASYRETIAPARESRDEALAAPRAERTRALKKADTKAERKAARRAYRKAAAPIKQEYRTARSAARATRAAAIEAALADYLVSTGKPDVADALSTYRSATQTAQETLELALASGRSVFRTDTADEREQLLSDLEQAGSPAEVAQAWADFVAECADERAAHAAAIAAARATYRSAKAEARAEFRAETDITISSLLKLPFKV
jgi:hypothetical protein